MGVKQYDAFFNPLPQIDGVFPRIEGEYSWLQCVGDAQCIRSSENSIALRVWNTKGYFRRI